VNDLAQRIAKLSPRQKCLLDLRLGAQRGVPEPIAIVGMGCRFPGAPQLAAYWQLLIQGQDAIGDIPSDRWSLEEFYDADPNQPGKHYCRQGGFLDHIDQFDPDFFGIAPREAPYIDPQQRLLLEVMWEALEDGGILPHTLGGTQAGVFVGASTLDYGQHLLLQADQIGPYTATGLASTMLANRLSYLLNLQGPSLTVDTACSSSLVAVHLACQSLWRGESSLALAAGVNVILTPALTIGFSKLTALSPESRCRAFDAAANGFVRAEGAGVVVLKPLSQALAQGDRIYALIRGGAINQDGRSNGLTAPNREAQAAVLRQAYHQARVPLAQVSYIEAHGTGTLLGDPIEAKALGEVFGPSHDQAPPIRLGSVKTNIGHTEAAAGIAGLIKAALCLHHRTWVPSLHFHQPNPYIPFEQLPLQVQTQVEPWAPFSPQVIAGVSSFGFGGTNAHLVLQAAPSATSQMSSPVSDPQRPGHLFTLSARSPAALRQLARQYGEQLSRLAPDQLGDFCYSANSDRTAFTYRCAAWVRDPATLVESLGALAAGQPVTGLQTALPCPSEAPPLVWLFTGQGSQYPDMGRQLYETQPVFRATLDRCDKILRPYLEDSLLAVIYPGSPEDYRLHQTLYTQPALFALEYALATLWRSWGLQPAAVLGHSVGEYVAACVAGVFDLETGLKLMAQRGQLMQSLPADGMMAAILADGETVAAMLAPFGEAVAIAALNGPQNTVVAGEREAVKALLEVCQDRQLMVTPLTVSHGFHSAQMDPILNVFEHLARQITFQPPQIPLVANLTGQLFAPGEVPDATYWRRHARQPVQFAAGMATLYQQGYRHFLEIGPHPVLSGLGQQCLSADEVQWFPCLARQRQDWGVLGTTLAQLYLAGIAIDGQGFDQPYGRRRIDLPTYAFQRQRYWIDPPTIAPAPHPSQAYRLSWLPQALPPSPQPSPHRWLVVGDQAALGRSLQQVLNQLGSKVERAIWGQPVPPMAPDHYPDYYFVDPQAPQPWQPLFSTLGDGALQVLYLAPEAPDPRGETALLSLIQALAHHPQPAKLWLITTGAQSTGPEDPLLAPDQAVLWGLGRTLRLEHPELWGGLVDLRPGPDWDPQAAVLVSHIQGQSREDEVALRTTQLWVPRLQRWADRQALASVGPTLDAQATYLITGGTGGLGQHLAHWLVAQGARHLVLLSRRGPSADLEPFLTRLTQAGAMVHVEAVDGADSSALTEVLTRLQAQSPPLKGIFHAAGALADGFLIHQTPDTYRAVLGPKLEAAWHLHHLTQTLNLDLDWFVLFSSITSLLGSPGQANYAAANAGLDALAQWRRQQGLPALSISWGPWHGPGMARDQEQFEGGWQQRGLTLMPAAAGLGWLGTLLSAPDFPAHLGIASLDWARLQRYLLTVPPVFSQLLMADAPVQEAGDSAQTPLRQRLLALPAADRRTALEQYLQTQLAVVMGRQDLPPLDRSLLDLGLDSLMTMDLLALCKQDLHLLLYPREVMAHPTLQDLARYLTQELERGEGADASSQPGTDNQLDGVEPLPAHPWQAPTPLDPLPSQRNGSMIFLLSAPRSGSTLLRVMLAGHPDLFCPPELHLLPFNTLEAQQLALGSTYLQEGLQRAVMELMQLDADQAETLLAEWRQHRLTMPAVYDKLQQMAAPRRLVDKSPTYSLSLETLKRAEQVFAGAKYIHLVRHPYAVMDSFVRNRMHKIFDLDSADPYGLAEQVWQTSNRNITTFLQGIAPSRSQVLRYEDLVADPETAMVRLCDFLGLPFDAAVLKPYEGRRMTDGVRARSLAVDDPNFRQRDHIEANLAEVWQTIQLPRRLTTASQEIAAQFTYPLPQETTTTPPRPHQPHRPLAQLREEFQVVRGRDTCVCHWGPSEGPSILCLHGILEQGASWDGVADPLAAEGYHVIAPDLRGHGRSAHAGPDGGYQLLDFLADIDQLSQILASDRPLLLVGHSMGAVLSGLLASLRPQRFRGLVLVEPVVPASDPGQGLPKQLVTHLDYLARPMAAVVMEDLAAATQRLQTLKPKLSSEAAERLAARLTSPAPDGQGLIWRWDPRLQGRTPFSLGAGWLDRQSYGQMLDQITLPTTLVLGQHSQFNRPEDLAFFATHLPQAHRLTLAGGHDLPVETPLELAQIIQDLSLETATHV
jgi:acyl transferase domain-containing protein/pimeloyl-ACP methyl ester carboxylesterase/acyl carrier protein